MKSDQRCECVWLSTAAREYHNQVKKDCAKSPPAQARARTLSCCGSAADIVWQGAELCKPQISAAGGPHCGSSHTASRTQHLTPCQSPAAGSVAGELDGHAHHLQKYDLMVMVS